MRVDNTAKNVMNKEFTNLFDDLPKDHLYNIVTEKASSKDTEEFLLCIEKIGDNKRRKFMEECIERESPFEERI